MDIHLNVTNSAVDYIAEAGFDAKYGARPLRRAIQSKIEDRLANELLEGKIKRGETSCRYSIEIKKFVLL